MDASGHKTLRRRDVACDRERADGAECHDDDANETDRPSAGGRKALSLLRVGPVEESAYTKEAASAWRLERRVPVAVILAILIQSAAALLWAGAANERLAALDTRTARIGELVERTARLEEQSKSAAGALARIEAKLERR
tara:strand:+ start:3577 stop:3996 length:420 start_codon:yes stop_codon:yes gene_type:complete